MRKILSLILLFFCVEFAWSQAGIFGIATGTTTGGTAVNTEVAQYIVIGSQPVNVSSISIYMGSGTNGGAVDVGIVAAPSATTQAGSVTCHMAWTEGTQTNQFVTRTLTGCGSLSANTAYWLYVNTSDSAFVVGKNACSGTCTGGAGSGQYGACAVAETFGTTTGLTTTFTSCPGTAMRQIYISTTPTFNTPISKLRTGRFF